MALIDSSMIHYLSLIITKTFAIKPDEYFLGESTITRKIKWKVKKTKITHHPINR